MLNNKVEEIKKIFPKSKVICRTVSSKTNDGIQELLLDIVCIANIKIKNLYIGNEDYEGFELVSDDVVERLKQRKPIKNKNNGIFSKLFNLND
jgi:hypothetical protein